MTDHRRYSVTYDPIDRLVRVVAWGFWAVDTVDRYAVDLGAAFDRARRDGPSVGFLLDATNCVPQSQEIGPRFAEAWKILLSNADDRAALVAGDSALVIRQLKRLYESERCQIFSKVAEAENWIKHQMKTR